MTTNRRQDDDVSDDGDVCGPVDVEVDVVVDVDGAVDGAVDVAVAGGAMIDMPARMTMMGRKPVLGAPLAARESSPRMTMMRGAGDTRDCVDADSKERA